jgi:rhamnosyltransferase
VTHVAAVVTAYNAGPTLADLCATLLLQCSTVVVVDDGSLSGGAVLDHCAALGCAIVRQPSNTGVAAALNAGVRAAGEPDFVLTLDQDSRIPDGYVAALVAANSAAVGAGVRVGMVAPERIEGLPSRVVGIRGDVTLGGEPIQSGLLFPRQAIDLLGDFLESLFIDSVDTEYYLRAKTAGLDVVIALGATLGHSLGERYYPTLFGRRLRFRGRDIGLVRSAPFRYYYIARNHIKMLKLYGRRETGWAVRETLLDIRHFFILIVVVPRRPRHLRLLLAGWRDGFRGVGGKIPSSLH